MQEEEVKQHEACKIKFCQLQINIWPNDGTENSHGWKRIYEMMNEYEREKEKGNFSIDTLCQKIKEMYEISVNSGIIWGDATAVFIQNSAKIDKKSN
jgi:hypothetical protein